MNAVVIFVVLSILLVAGKILRMQIPLLQKLYLPSSIVGGLLGLSLISAFGDKLPDGVVSEMRSMPGFLINIIFATLFLGGGAPKAKKIASSVLPSPARACPSQKYRDPRGFLNPAASVSGICFSRMRRILSSP